ncbi:MAG: secretin N-terminal domain-containing protein [Candidatus Hydrogenedentes bacterium]|nr:secretin N-terminal domain-containing protein [Candidatus Hydrogenedentota bacterium]
MVQYTRYTWILAVGALIALFGFASNAQQSPTQPAPAPTVDASVGAILMQDTAQAEAESRARQPQEQATPRAQEPGKSTGVTAIQGDRRQVTIGGEGAFEPILLEAMPMVALPDEGEPITLNASDAPVSVIEVLDAVATATGWNIVASTGVEEKSIRFWVTNVKPRQVMEILKFNNIHYEFEPETRFLYVMLDGEFLEREYGALKKAEFSIEHADVMDMEAVLNGLMSQTGRLISDPRTGSVLVWDTQANLKAMSEAVDRLDVPLEPRVFMLQHLAADDLLETIQSLLSERGLAQADPRANSIVVTDLPARQDQIATMLEALDKPLITKTWTLRYIEPEAVSERLENIIPEETGVITTDENTHQVSLTAIASRIEEVDAMIADWDVKGKQVQIEAFLVSAATTVLRDLSIDWAYFDDIAGSPFSIQSGGNRPNYTAAPEAGQRVSGGRYPYRAFLRDPVTGAIRQEVSNPGGAEAGSLTGRNILDPEFKGDRIAVVLDFLDSTGELNILARPRVTVQDGEEATFENTTDQPFQSVGFTGFGGTVIDGGNDPVNDVSSRVIPGQVQFIKVGTILKVKPRINEESNILMEIESEESSAEDKTILAGGLASTIPQKTQNKAQTKVLVNDGQTIVIGGLRAMSVKDDVERVPILAELPFIGRLFKNTSKDHIDRELAVFITPTIVDEFTQPEAERAAAFDEENTDKMRHTEKGIFGRTGDRLAKGENELSVSVGHTGAIFSEGKIVTESDLGAKFDTYRDAKPKPTVIVRVHPDAPEGIEVRIREMAMIAGLKMTTEIDHRPFVPAPRDQAPMR